MITRLESQMRQNFNQPTFLYEATRVYLEPGLLGPLDRDLIKEWMHFDWQAAWPDPAEVDTRDRLGTDLAALPDNRLPKIQLDGALLEDVSLADRFTLTFTLADRQAVFEIRAGSVLDPLVLGTLRDFRCPAL